MKTKSLINKIKKAGFNVQQVEGRRQYTVVNGNTELSFHDQEGSVVCLKTKPVDNYGDDNPFNGNCYNFFCSSMKSAVENLVNDWHGRHKKAV